MDCPNHPSKNLATPNLPVFDLSHQETVWLMISSSTAQSFHAGWETLVLGVWYENVELNRYDVSGLKGFSVLSAVFFICLREENSWLVAWEGISHSISRNWMCCVVRRLCWNTMLNHVCTCVPCMPHSFLFSTAAANIAWAEWWICGKQPLWALSAQSSFKLFFLRLIESYSSSRLRLIFIHMSYNLASIRHAVWKSWLFSRH